jgi:hypothetical protein
MYLFQLPAYNEEHCDVVLHLHMNNLQIINDVVLNGKII